MKKAFLKSHSRGEFIVFRVMAYIINGYRGSRPFDGIKLKYENNVILTRHGLFALKRVRPLRQIENKNRFRASL